MFTRSKVLVVMSTLLVLSMVLAACAPTTTEVVRTVVVTEVVTEAGATQVVEKVVTATPEPPQPVEKTFVVCMAQEPSTLYIWSESALVKTAVNEAMYDFGVDTRNFSYQPVGLVKLPSFEDGDAVKNEVEVTIGDTVYDAATDEVVTITPTSTVTLNQMDDSQLLVDFAVTPTAKTVQLKVTWTMVDGITWEDGTPVTTDDIIFSWEVGKHPDTPWQKYTFDRSASYEAVDEKSWTWTSLPGYTSGTYFSDAVVVPMPKHILGNMTPAQILADESVNRDPLVFGPFTVEEWIAGDRITLKKNPTYYRASEGLPKVDTLVYRFVPDSNQLIAQLASGECDLGTQDGAFEGSLPLIREFEAQGLLVPQVVAGTVFEHFDFNAMPVESYTGFAGRVKNADGTPIFANPEIRQAIAYCVDRQAIVDQATNGAAVVQHVYVPADHPLYAGDDNITIYPFDPAKGLELLAKNGWTDTDGDGILDNGKGEKFSFIHSTRTNPLRQKVTQITQQQLKENCMIETKIELYGSEYFADGPDGLVFGRKYDMGEFAWLTGVEPPCDLYKSTNLPQEGNWGAQNNVGFMNAEFDAACGAATTALDETVKAEQHALAQKIFTQFLPSLTLFARAKILVTRPEVTGVIMDATANSELWNVENFDITMP